MGLLCTSERRHKICAYLPFQNFIQRQLTTTRTIFVQLSAILRFLFSRYSDIEISRKKTIFLSKEHFKKVYHNVKVTNKLNEPFPLLLEFLPTSLKKVESLEVAAKNYNPKQKILTGHWLSTEVPRTKLCYTA